MKRSKILLTGIPIAAALLFCFNWSVSAEATSDFAVQHAGKIFLQVEDNGEAWYVNPDDYLRYYLSRREDAFAIMRDLGTGITNANLERIPGEGSPVLEENAAFVESVKGKILLQVEANGEAWYVDPSNGQRYYLGRPDDAFRIMRERGVGATTANIKLIQPDVTLESHNRDGVGGTQSINTYTIVNHGSLNHSGEDFTLRDSDGDSFELNANMPAAGSTLTVIQVGTDASLDDEVIAYNELSSEGIIVWRNDPYIINAPGDVLFHGGLRGPNDTIYEWATPYFRKVCGDETFLEGTSGGGTCARYFL
ncbi:MAG: hypothetical protein KC925_00290 [Candidatus Doudnabacteria bacterium]|nr:hypothetical protein [Candidatus Doudnabacteria bacterium]